MVGLNDAPQQWLTELALAAVQSLAELQQTQWRNSRNKVVKVRL